MAAEIAIKVSVRKEVIAELLSSAFNAGDTHGCGYWARPYRNHSNRPYVLTEFSAPKFRKQAIAECGTWLKKETWNVHWPLFDGGSLCLVEHMDESEDEPVEHILNQGAFANGLAIMAKEFPAEFGQVLAGNIDGPLGDLFLQCVCFGHEKYG